MRLSRRRPSVTSLPGPGRPRTVAIVALTAGALLVAGGGGAVAAVALAPHAVDAAVATAPIAHAAAVDTTGFPKGGVGIFTDRCAPVTTAANDPILMPGMTGKSMQHDFFGHVGTTASTTPAQLPGGRTSCSTTADSSAYWTPVLYQDGKALKPSSALIYWRAPQSTSTSVRTIPAGLTIIAGDEGASQPQSTHVIAWHCSTPGGTTKQAPATAMPHDCAAGTLLRLVVFFPNCWDGHTLDGSKQQNVVYPSTPDGACPASHPVQIPQIVFHENYPTRSAAGITLSIGPDAQGSATTEHADFMNGWTESTLTADVAACTAAQVRCGPVKGADATPQGGRKTADSGTHDRKSTMHAHARKKQAATNA